MCNFFGETNEGKEVFSVCVCVVKGKHVNTSLLCHNFLQVHHTFGLCHLLSIPSKIHLLVLVNLFQQHKFSQIIYLHSFTELFHKIFLAHQNKLKLSLKATCNSL